MAGLLRGVLVSTLFYIEFGHSFNGSVAALPGARGARWWRYTIPGTGDVDWNLRVTRLEDHGYDGPLSIELEDQRFWATPEAKLEGLLRAKEHLEPILR